MKILQINKFLYNYGGADTHFIGLSQLFESKGHKVIYFSMDHPKNSHQELRIFFPSYVNTEGRISLLDMIKISKRMFYSFEVRRKLKRLIQEYNPDIAHIHNLHIHLSVSVIDELKINKIPIVMTLHDHKIVCPINILFTHGKVCELCQNKRFYNCLLNKCMNNSFSRSFSVMLESYLSTLLKSYDKVDVLISPSKFLIKQVKKMGFKKEIIHMPNFIDMDSYLPLIGFENNNEITYFGRLVEEKGIPILLDAVKNTKARLKIIGDGAQRRELEEKVRKEGINNVIFIGKLEKAQLQNEISKSMFTVLPSICYDNYPHMVLESFALGKPVIGSAIGGIPELVKDSETGFLFEPGNAKQLREKIEFLLTNPQLCFRFGKNARKYIEENCTADKFYPSLIKEYNKLTKN